MTPFEARINRLTRRFIAALDDRLKGFQFIDDVMDEETHYEGTPCKNGHTQRYLRGHNCVQCTKDASQNSKKAKREAQVA